MLIDGQYTCIYTMKKQTNKQTNKNKERERERERETPKLLFHLDVHNWLYSPSIRAQPRMDLFAQGLVQLGGHLLHRRLALTR